MLPFIFGQKSLIHIINLDVSIKYWLEAQKFVNKIIAEGGNFLFVGTKQQASDIIKEAAERSESFYVNNRWLGGTLSNFQTIKKSISRMNKMEEMLEKADDEKSKVKLAKKEKLSISKDLIKLESNLSGIRKMRKLPDAIFVVDINKDSIAISEARKLHIPIIAMVDTNVNPDLVEYPIPSNDDASGAIYLFANAIADTIIKGKATLKRKLQEDKVVQEKEVSNTEKIVEPEVSGSSVSVQ
ncbi:UNVERIFIED_CONTAM: hypothetical protein GTU68_014593 [Idotea baltica]|nr:hypothetical protein [Idotea baltica]